MFNIVFNEVDNICCCFYLYKWFGVNGDEVGEFFIVLGSEVYFV